MPDRALSRALAAPDRIRARRRNAATAAGLTLPAMRTTAIVPFALCAVVALVTVFVPPYGHDVVELTVAGGLLVLVLGAAMVLPWERWPAWTHAIAPLSFFVVIAVMRDGSGGAASGLAPMVAIPVLWLALFGTRWALHVAGVATALVFLLPLFLIGAPNYPLSDWRRAAVWMAVVWLIGPFVQSVVRRLATRERHQAGMVEDLASAERQWRVFADELPDTVVLIVNEDLRYELIAGAGTLRQGLEHWQGRTLAESSSPENVALLEPLYREALAGRRGTTTLAATNSHLLHEVVVVPFTHHGRRCAMVVARDVSEAQRSEDAIRTLNQRVERLIDDAPTGVVVADLDGTVTRMNDALRDVLGMPADEPAPGTTLESLGLVRSTSEVISLAAESPRGRHISDVRLTVRDMEVVDLTVDVVVLHGAESVPESLLVHVHDISERRRFEERLEHLAAHDPLTGLANRRRFDEALDHHLKDCARYGARGAVLMLDLDHFKEVNDTFGHDVGDQLITSVGSLLSTVLRESDTVARLGGDEFAVLIPRGGRPEAERVAERITDAVRAQASALDPRSARPITASIGVVVINDAHTTAGELLIAADMTMYDAKDAGRDRYEIFDALDHAKPRTAARLNWANRIRQALREDRFELHAQPVVDLATRSVTGAELLLRMVDDDGTLVAPGRFLYIAERMGLAPQVDRWVVERDVEHLADLIAAGNPLRLSINVSAHSINDLSFVDGVVELVQGAAVDPGLLVFEITETAAIANMERARMFAHRLHELGCKLALDDFGAGHASFYYLKHLPFDYIKIDGEFVRSCTTNTSDRLVIESVVAFSAGTGRQTVAEYVGDELTENLLRELHVDLGQGFHLGRPQPWADFLLGTGLRT